MKWFIFFFTYNLRKTNNIFFIIYLFFCLLLVNFQTNLAKKKKIIIITPKNNQVWYHSGGRGINQVGVTSIKWAWHQPGGRDITSNTVTAGWGSVVMGVVYIGYSYVAWPHLTSWPTCPRSSFSPWGHPAPYLPLWSLEVRCPLKHIDYKAIAKAGSGQGRSSLG